MACPRWEPLRYIQYELTKIKSSPKRQNATCLPTSSPDAGFDRHKGRCLASHWVKEGVKAGACLLAGVRGNEHAWGSKEKATRGLEHCLCQSHVSVAECASSLDFRLILNHQYCDSRTRKNCNPASIPAGLRSG